jgi:hypothetical protein
VLKFRPGLGLRSYVAIFSGTNAFAKSSSADSKLTVTAPSPPVPYPTTTTLTSVGSATSQTYTATVTGYLCGSSARPPTGTVSILDTENGNATVGAAKLDVGPSGFGWEFGGSGPSYLNGEILYIVVGDFNGDGIDDVARLPEEFKRFLGRLREDSLPRRRAV